MTIGFLVDGHMEKLIIQKLCKLAHVRILNINGKNVKMSAIAVRAATHIRLMKHARPIVIIFDREKRQEDCSNLRDELLQCLEKEGIDTKEVIVGIPDTMLENWIIACNKTKRKYEIVDDCEGGHGKRVLERALNKKEIDYHKTTVGVDLFSEIDVHTAMQNSASFKNLALSLRPHCKWIKDADVKRQGKKQPRSHETIDAS
jgi:Tfp pilus assembly PilM family ATPase